VFRYYLAAAGFTLLTAIGQLLLKRGARTDRGPVTRLWLNRWTAGGYALLFVVTLLALYAYKVLPLRAAVVLAPLSFLLVTVLSVLLFRERLTRIQAIGCALIVAGLILFNL